MGKMKALLGKSEEICKWSHSKFCEGCRQFIAMKNAKNESVMVTYNPKEKKIEEVENED